MHIQRLAKLQNIADINQQGLDILEFYKFVFSYHSHNKIKSYQIKLSNLSVTKLRLSNIAHIYFSACNIYIPHVAYQFSR